MGPPDSTIGRNIEPGRGHSHARDDLVAVRHHDEGVQRVALGHHLYGIHDEFAAGQGEFHALVIHGYAVADADNGELQGKPARRVDARLDGFREPLEVDVAGYDRVVRVDDAYPGPFDFPVGVAGRLHQAIGAAPAR